MAFMISVIRPGDQYLLPAISREKQAEQGLIRDLKELAESCQHCANRVHLERSARDIPAGSPLARTREEVNQQLREVIREPINLILRGIQSTRERAAIVETMHQILDQLTIDNFEHIEGKMRGQLFTLFHTLSEEEISSLPSSRASDEFSREAKETDSKMKAACELEEEWERLAAFELLYRDLISVHGREGEAIEFAKIVDKEFGDPRFLNRFLSIFAEKHHYATAYSMAVGRQWDEVLGGREPIRPSLLSRVALSLAQEGHLTEAFRVNERVIEDLNGQTEVYQLIIDACLTPQQNQFPLAVMVKEKIQIPEEKRLAEIKIKTFDGDLEGALRMVDGLRDARVKIRALQAVRTIVEMWGDPKALQDLLENRFMV